MNNYFFSPFLDFFPSPQLRGIVHNWQGLVRWTWGPMGVGPLKGLSHRRRKLLSLSAALPAPCLILMIILQARKWRLTESEYRCLTLSQWLPVDAGVQDALTYSRVHHTAPLPNLHHCLEALGSPESVCSEGSLVLGLFPPMEGLAM